MTKIKRKKLNHRMAQDKKYVCENLVLILWFKNNKGVLTQITQRDTEKNSKQQEKGHQNGV